MVTRQMTDRGGLWPHPCEEHLRVSKQTDKSISDSRLGVRLRACPGGFQASALCLQEWRKSRAEAREPPRPAGWRHTRKENGARNRYKIFFLTPPTGPVGSCQNRVQVFGKGRDSHVDCPKFRLVIRNRCLRWNCPCHCRCFLRRQFRLPDLRRRPRRWPRP